MDGGKYEAVKLKDQSTIAERSKEVANWLKESKQRELTLPELLPAELCCVLVLADHVEPSSPTEHCISGAVVAEIRSWHPVRYLGWIPPFCRV